MVRDVNRCNSFLLSVEINYFNVSFMLSFFLEFLSLYIYFRWINVSLNNAWEASWLKDYTCKYG